VKQALTLWTSQLKEDLMLMEKDGQQEAEVEKENLKTFTSNVQDKVI
jgi:hypothetical protein